MLDNILLGCPLEIGEVPFDTKEFNFTSHMNVAREGFTGRQWLYHNLESLLLNSEDDNVPGVVVVGESGAGKSALSAQLICSRSSNIIPTFTNALLATNYASIQIKRRRTLAVLFEI